MILRANVGMHGAGSDSPSNRAGLRRVAQGGGLGRSVLRGLRGLRGRALVKKVQQILGLRGGLGFKPLATPKTLGYNCYKSKRKAVCH